MQRARSTETVLGTAIERLPADSRPALLVSDLHVPEGGGPVVAGRSWLGPWGFPTLTTMTTVFRNGRLPTGRTVDVTVDEGRIVAVEHHDPFAHGGPPGQRIDFRLAERGVVGKLVRRLRRKPWRHLLLQHRGPNSTRPRPRVVI